MPYTVLVRKGRTSLYRREMAFERRLHRVRLAIAICLCVCGITYLLLSSLGAELWHLLIHPDLERFQQWLDAQAGWVPLILIVGMIAHTFVPLPAELLAVAAGMVLGSFWGVVTIWTGALLGAYLGFSWRVSLANHSCCVWPAKSVYNACRIGWIRRM